MKRSAISACVVVVAAIFLSHCGSSTPTMSGSTPTPTATTAAKADVVIMVNGVDGNMSFSPASVTVKSGQTVAWQNADSITHHMIDNGGAFDTGNLGGGATSAPIKLTATGTFPYHCTIHPSMTGTITVTN